MFDIKSMDDIRTILINRSKMNGELCSFEEVKILNAPMIESLGISADDKDNLDALDCMEGEYPIDADILMKRFGLHSAKTNISHVKRVLLKAEIIEEESISNNYCRVVYVQIEKNKQFHQQIRYMITKEAARIILMSMCKDKKYVRYFSNQIELNGMYKKYQSDYIIWQRELALQHANNIIQQMNQKIDSQSADIKSLIMYAKYS